MLIVEDVHVQIFTINRTNQPKLLSSLVHANMLLILHSPGLAPFKTAPLSVDLGCGLQNVVHYVLHWINFWIVIAKLTLPLKVLVIVSGSRVKPIHLLPLYENRVVTLRKFVSLIGKLLVCHALILRFLLNELAWLTKLPLNLRNRDQLVEIS